MQKIDTLFSALPRLVRDTAATLGKAVNLLIDGADVELDRELIEMMRDPLVHLIRNAVDHGIEAPAVRRASGKREAGRLAISAHQSGNQIVIEIVDDGRGVDVERLIAKLVASGRSEAGLRALDERQRLELMFEPGLTSAETVSAISGRGVGMDVVRDNIEQIGGRIYLANTPGHGLRVTINVPLTLSILPAIVVGSGGLRFAVARQAIEEILSAGADSVRVDELGDRSVVTVHGRRMPLVDLGQALGTGGRSEMLVVLNTSGGSYAIGVDAVLDSEELVIKPCAPVVMATGLYAGQTLPDTGSPMLLLDAAGIAARAGISFGRRTEAEPEDEGGPTAAPVPALLFADLDGATRLVPLAVLDRIEQAAAHEVAWSAGRLHWQVAGAIVPLVANTPLDPDASVTVLRFSAGHHVLGYAVREALDVVALPAELVPAAAPGPVAGVVALDGEQIEVLDVQWLFAAHIGAGRQEGPTPICLLEGARADWLDGFLRPMLQAAGYRVTRTLAAGERAAVVLATDDDGSTVRIDDTARVSLYDRDGLLSALRTAGGSR